MKKRLALAVSAMLAISMLAGCGSKTEQAAATTAVETKAEETAAEETKAEEAAAEETTAEETAAAEEKEVSADNPFNGVTVKVGCSATFVPYESIEMASDGSKTYVGMNIDLITAIVEKNGGKVEFVDMPFKSLMAAIQAKQIDFCSGGMAPTEERQKTLDFTEVFFYPRNAIVYRSEDNYPDLASLAGKKVAYVFGTNYQQVAESIENVEAVGIQGSPACIEEVKSKRADACIIDGAGAAEFLKNNDTLSMSLLEKTDDCFAVGFPKESPYYETFNNTLKEMMENGELDEIIKNHLNEQFILE